jgi:hypothetical protein
LSDGLGVFFAYGDKVAGFISNGIGYYKFEHGYTHAEASTMSEAFHILTVTILKDPLPFILYSALWLAISIIAIIHIKKYLILHNFFDAK